MFTRRAALLALAVLALAIGAAGVRPEQADAHAVLVRSLPESQAQLAESPSTIDLWFSEDLEAGFSTFELFASNGAPQTVDGIRIDPADPQHLSGLVRTLDPGVYTIVYRTLSTADGHEWSGSLTFTILNPDGSIPTAQAFNPDVGTGTSPAEVTGRWFVFVAFSIVLGGALISLLAERAERQARNVPWGFARRVRRLAVLLGLAALPLGAAGTLLQFMAQHESLGGSALALLSESRFGILLLWRALAFLAVTGALLLALLAAHRGRPREERVALAAAAAVSTAGLATITLLSHAAAAPGTYWALAADLAHLVLASFWVGGLIVLAVLLVRMNRTGLDRRAPLSTLLDAFSVFAALSLYILAATGTVRSLGELPSAEALVETAYGRWLIAKLVLIAPLLGIAFLNRELLYRWGQRQLSETAARARLRRLIPAEAALACLVLFVVAVLGQTPTPRGYELPPEAATVFGSYNRIERINDLTVHLQVTPAGVGPNELRVHLYRDDNSDVGTVERVLLILSAQGAGGGDELTAADEGDGVYTTTASLSSLSAEWDVSVDVRRLEFDDARVSFGVPIDPNSGVAAGASSFGSPAPQLRAGYLHGIVLLLGGIGLILFEPRRRSWFATSMRLGGSAAVVGAIALGLLAFRSEDQLILQNPSAGDPQALVRGAAIFGEHCAACHGVGGGGDGPLAAALTTPPADLVYHVPLHTETETYVFIADGFPDTDMPAWDETLSSSEIWDVVNFLRDEFGD